MTLFVKYAILLRFKNDSDICIHCLQVFNMKWKKNQFGGRKVISNDACALGTESGRAIAK